MSTQLDKIWMLLHDAAGDMDTKSKVGPEGKYIRTPFTICEEIVGEIIKSACDISNKRILVVDTVEFIPLLLKFGAKSCNITYVAPYHFKGKIAAALGVTVIRQSLLDLENKDKMKFDVVVGNPPYTDGSEGALEIYTTFIERIYTECRPDILAMVTPENFVNGGRERKAAREKLATTMSFSYINFLHKDYDWKGMIDIDTVAWVMLGHENKTVSIIGRYGKEKYTTGCSKEYINGETQQIYDWIQLIQTDKKIKILNAKKLSTPGPEIKISKNNSGKVIDGYIHTSHNDEWRVAFGIMRSQNCCIVAPGVSVPTKYIYVRFGNDESTARKFVSYMLSGPIRLIMKLTHTGRALRNAQLRFVPFINFDQFQIINDDILYKYWNINLEDDIKKLVGNEVPF